MTKKLNGNGKATVAETALRVSPADQTPPATLIDFIPARVAFRDVFEPLAYVTLQALGIEPTEEIDPRFFGFERDQLRGWSAVEIEPLRAALVYTTNARTITAVIEAGTTIDVRHRPQLVPFATFFPTERGQLPRDPTPPATRWLEAEEKARCFTAWGMSEEEAGGMFAPFKEEKFRDEIVAQEIVPRVVIASGPHTKTSYLLASYPTDNLIWTCGLLNPVPLRRAEVVQNRYETAEEWNKRGTRASGHI